MSNNSKPKIVGTTTHSNGTTKYTIKDKDTTESMNAATLLTNYKKNALSNDNTTKKFYEEAEAKKAEANKAAANKEAANKEAANKEAANKAAANKAAANKEAANKEAANKAAANKNAANKPVVQPPPLPPAANGPAANGPAANGSAANGLAANGLAAVPSPPPYGPEQLAVINAKAKANTVAPAVANAKVANAAVAAVNANIEAVAAVNANAVPPTGTPLDPASRSTVSEEYFTVTTKDGTKFSTSIYKSLEEAQTEGKPIVHIIYANGHYTKGPKSTNATKGGRTRRNKKVQRKSKTQRKYKSHRK